MRRVATDGRNRWIPPTSLRAGKHRLTLTSGAVVLAAVALYSPSIGFGFVWDDAGLVTASDAPARGTLAAIWSEPFPIGSGAYYRPATLSLLWTEHLAFGLDSRGFHAVQIGLYALCCALVFRLAGELRRSDGRSDAGVLAATAAAAVFAVHPVHVETVTFISAVADLLAAAFAMTAVIAAVRSVDGARRGTTMPWSVASGLATFWALLAKEVGIVVPVLCWLAVRVRPPSARRTRAAQAVLWAQAGAVALYLPLRLWALGGVGSDLTFGRPLDVLATLGRSAELLLFPVRLRAYHRFDPAVAPWDAAVVGIVVAVASIAALVAYRRRRRLAYAVAWVWIALAPASGIVDIPGAPVAERFLFLPSVGIALLAGEILAWRRVRYRRPVRRAAAVIAVAVVLALAARAAVRLPVYRSNEAVFETILRESPTFYYGHLGLGMARQRAGRSDEAIRLLEDAVRLGGPGRPGDPRRGDAERWLGLAYLSEGRAEEAIAPLEAAARLRPDDDEVRVNLASALLQTGRADDAEGVLAEALGLNPDLGEAAANLGLLLARRGDHAGALPHLERAAELLPRRPDVLFNLANGYARIGRDRDAEATFRRVLAIRPDFADARRNLAIVLERNRDPLERSGGTELRPDD